MAERCAQLANFLPERLEKLRPRVISPRSPLDHAWGSPAVILRCGVGLPPGYSATSSETTAVDNVDWYRVPGSKTQTWTALRPGPVANQTVNVELQVPNHYKEQGAFLVDLAAPLKSAFPD